MARVVFVAKKEELDAVREGLADYLETWDACFLTTPEGAIEALSSATSSVVVADWDHAGGGGMTLCQKVRAMSKVAGRADCYLIGVTDQSPEGRGGSLESLYSAVDDFVRRPYEPAELAARIRAGLRVVRAERALRESNDELKNLVVTDPLTGLLTRRRGEEVLHAELARVVRGQEDLTVVMVGIDRFEALEESLGLDGADALLRQIAARYLRGSRVYDAAIRWGRSEILLVLPHAGRAHAEAVARRMQRLVSESPIALAPDKVVPVGACFGVVTVPKGADVSAGRLVRAASEATERARREGPNHITYASAD